MSVSGDLRSETGTPGYSTPGYTCSVYALYEKLKRIFVHPVVINLNSNVNRKLHPETHEIYFN